ncbi:transporter substrate-binding domain-containing protein [Devosia sp. A8/3-2]|nr:transporter substrate-binding domain-containing protein [Devosia sp. A8/3-2]
MVGRGWSRALQCVIASLLLATPAFAQSLPYHSDPSAREILPSLSPVPAIRFLTTTDFPPFNFHDPGGELIGFNVDLARRICTEVNVACTIRARPREQAADALADSRGDALIAGLDMSDENGKRFDFSATYLALPGRFVTRSADIATFDATALVGKNIAVRGGSVHEAFVKRYLPGANIVAFATEVEAPAAVQSRAADLFSATPCAPRSGSMKIWIAAASLATPISAPPSSAKASPSPSPPAMTPCVTPSTGP